MVNKVEQFFRDVKANAAAKRPGQDTGNKPAPKPEAKGQTVAVQPRPDTKPGGSQGAGQGGQQPARAQGQGGQGQRSDRDRRSSQGSQGGGQGQRHDRDRRGGQGGPQGQSQGGQGQRYGDRRGGQGGQSQGQGGQQNRGGQHQGQGGQQNRGGQGQGQGQGGQRGGRPGDRPQGQQQRPNDNRFGGGQNRPGGQAKGAALPVDSSAGAAGGKGKNGKKSKPNQNQNQNQKRYEDNGKALNGRFSGGRGGQRNQQRGKQQSDQPKRDNTPKKIIVRGTMTVGELAKLLHKEASEVIKKLLFLGVMATINQELDLDTIQLIATEFGVEVELKIPIEEDKFEEIEEKDDEADLKERPPVVTIMGHVDHGKTTLLDSIRKTNVTEGEAGGITQHIGAYQVEVHGKKITFLDTPGHEAFTSMRARGAQVTDITILVVAADDGVMPQTVEAINHAKAAKVPIIVAVNKIDKPEADIDRIKQALMEYELVPEEWGGDTIFCNVSAKQRIGLDNLLDMILLVAEVQELKANPNKRARGTVIEAELDKGKGPVARVLVQHGTLKVGDTFVAGVHFGRVRAMINDKGKRLKEAGPSTPVEITGLTDVPQAGDPFLVFEDERKARAIADKRAVTLRETNMGANARVTLDDLYKQIKEGEIKDLNVIIKADVQGSAEALKGSLEKIDIEGVRVKILHIGAGAITESDVILAQASNAIIIGFNVRPEPLAKAAADQEKVDIRLHRIIYNVIEEIEQAMKGMLDPVYKEVVIGHAEVRNTFKVSKIGTIAGCMITSGKITRAAEVRLIRDGIVVFEGKIDSLKRYKDDVREVAQGYECGISLDKYNDIKEGDTIEAFVMETVER